MPNLRSLAEQGAQFVGHYTNGPQCVCGRSALWTGRRTNDIHVYNNAFGIAATSSGTLDTQCIKNYDKAKCEAVHTVQSINYTMLDAMESMGYNVYLYGKLHIGGGIMEQPIGVNLTAEAFEAPQSGNSFSSITRSANILKNYGNESNSAGPINSIDDNDPNPHGSDAKFASECVERLNNLGAAAQSKPFFLYCSIIAPHPPWHTNSTWIEKGVNLNKIVIPNWNKSRYNEFDQYTSIFENLWDENYTNEEFIDFRKTYYGLNVQADYLLGEVINASYLNGFNLTNTYFVFTSDHGEMNLDHREVAKNSLYEGAARIPLFISGPNISSKIIKNFTETVDILPTLLSLGENDKNAPDWLAGTTLMPFLDGNNNDNKHPDYVTSQYHSKNANTGLFMVRKGKYKYIQYGHYLNAFKDYKPQLFNLEDDPYELNDISSENENVVNEMEKLLLDRYDYEFADCVAKQTDMNIFNQFIWNVYNESQVYQLFKQTYKGFNSTDWDQVVKWRNELTNSPKCQSNA